MTTSTFTTYFGDPVATDENDEHIEKFHNTSVIFPESIRPTRKQKLLDMLEHVYIAFHAHRLDYLFSGVVRFVNLTGVTGGTYATESKEIRIKTLADDTSQTLKNIFHEYGHKHYYEFLSKQQRTQITQKFSELESQGKIRDAKKLFSRNNMSMISKDAEITYVGKSKKYSENNPYSVVTISPNDITIRGTNSRGTLRAPASLFWHSPDWVINNGHVPSSEIDEWFPTEYSTTNASEWYAEAFQNFVTDTLGKEAKVWFTPYFLNHS